MVVLACLLAACAREYQSFRPPPLDFGDRPPLALAVDRVTVQSAHRPQGAPPFVEHTLALTPEAATRQLLEHRLEAVGGTGSVQAVILDASVEEESLAKQEGVRGYLTTEPTARLRGRIKVRIDRLDENGDMLRAVTTEVSRTRTLLENTPYAQRQQLGYELVRDLVNDLDAALISSIRENLESALAS